MMLSHDIKQIELEINHHKNIAGHSIWEIGRRLNHVKENDLAHGEFMAWINSIGMEYKEAQRFMKIANELPEWTTLSNLGSQTLYLIATLPEEERTKEHVTNKGEVKTPDEMTVRELQDLKKQLKQKDELIESLGDSMHDFEVYAKELENENEKLKNQKPQVVEKVIEKEPEDYRTIKERNQNMEQQLSQLTNDLKLARTKYELLESNTAEAKQLKQQIDSLKGEQNELLEAVEATKDLHKLEREFHQFFDERLAPMKFKGISQYIGATNASSRIYDLINLAEAWVEEMRRLIPNGNIKIIEGEFTDE